MICTLQMTLASLQEGVYQPVGHDAFYHAARMLTVANGEELPQFDPRMHAPEGDWVQWPWAYDYVMGRLARFAAGVFGLNPATALMHLPVVLALTGVALIVAITQCLGIPVAFALLATLAFSLHPFTQYQFGVGALDHHGTEQLLTLASLLLGLRWLQQPNALSRPGWLGAILGLAVGVHTGLFILQVPIVLTVLLSWLRGWQPPARAAVAFALGLVGATILMVIPPLITTDPGFDLRHLSWLHLYVAVATSTVVLASSRLQWGQVRHAAAMLAIVLILAIPLLATIIFLGQFAAADLPSIAQIDEIRSPFSLIREPLGVRRLSQVYSLLVWLAPIVLIGCIVSMVRERSIDRRFFWIASAFGLGLLLLQQRLAVFGVFALYLPLLVWGSDLWRARPALQPRVVWGSIALFGIAYLPALAFQLFGSRIPSMDEHYSSARVLLPVLTAACAREPGIVLADPGDGHLVRYFTDCAVIANNFRLTQMDIRKIDQALDLIGSRLEDLRTSAPFVRYVFARLIMPAESSDPRLFEDLLRRQGELPTGVSVIGEVALQRPDGRSERLLGVYRIESLRSSAADAIN